jgi:hypothetical protein
MLGQIREVVSVSRAVDRLRSEVGPADLLTQLRQQGGTRTRRDQSARRRLHRLISVIDRLLPRPANCYRRALVEIAMDAGASHSISLSVRVGARTQATPGSARRRIPPVVTTRHSLSDSHSLIRDRVFETRQRVGHGRLERARRRDHQAAHLEKVPPIRAPDDAVRENPDQGLRG